MSIIKCFWLVMAVGFLFCFAGSAVAERTEIHWWLQCVVLVVTLYKKLLMVLTVFRPITKLYLLTKANMMKSVNAGAAAVRAGKQPHILQSLKVAPIQ